MTHDRNGRVVVEGDIVNIPCRVKSVQAGIEYCNVTVETLDPMPPYSVPNTITLNTRQVEIVVPPEQIYPKDVPADAEA